MRCLRLQADDANRVCVYGQRDMPPNTTNPCTNANSVDISIAAFSRPAQHAGGPATGTDLTVRTNCPCAAVGTGLTRCVRLLHLALALAFLPSSSCLPCRNAILLLHWLGWRVQHLQVALSPSQSRPLYSFQAAE